MGLLKRALLVLGWVWTLPNTLVFVLVALLGGAVFHRLQPSGVLWFVGRRGFWSWYFGTYNAITVGCCTISEEHPSVYENPIVIRHERIHSHQSMWMGVLYGPIYGMCSLVAKLQGLDAYWDNAMELQAYATERDTSK